MKLYVWLISAFLIVTALVGLVGFVSISQHKQSLEKIIGESSTMLVQETIDKIDRDIHNRLEQVQAFSAGLVDEELLVQSNRDFSDMPNVQDYINQQDEAWKTASETTPFMSEIINNELSQKIRQEFELNDYYNENEGYEVFSEVFITNKFGVNVAQSQKTGDFFQADEEWWQKAKEKGIFVSDAEYDNSAEVYSLELAVKIEDKNGNFLGVVKAIYNLEGVITIITSLDPERGENTRHVAHGHIEHKTMSFLLLSKEGKKLYSSEEFEIFENVSEKITKYIVDLPDSSGHKVYFITSGDEPGEGEELFAHAHSKGYKDFEGLGWILIVEHETEELFATNKKSTNIILFISLIALIASVLIGFFVARSVSKQLKKITESVNDVSKGNLKIEIKETGKIDEINELAKSLNTIMKSLKLAVLENRSTNVIAKKATNKEGKK